MKPWAGFHLIFLVASSVVGDVSNRGTAGSQDTEATCCARIQQLRIDLEDFNGSRTFATYSSFRIANESENYKLMLGSYLDGNVGDSLSGHNNYAFSTKDRDNDISAGNCAVSYKGAWWYTNCHSSNLNGLYHKGEHSSYADGINWYAGKGHHYSYKYADMKIRPQ